MPHSTQKRNIKEARRKEILNTAAILFAQKGFHHVKMDDIAEEIGLSKGTLYLYFENKEMLFISIIVEKSKQLTERLYQVIDCNDIFEICFEKFLQSTLEFFNQNRSYFKLLNSEKMSMTLEEHYKLHEYGKQSMDNLYDLIFKVVKMGIQNNYFKKINEKIIIKSLRGLIHTFLLDIILEEETIEIHKTTKDIMEVFLYGVKA